MRESDVKQEIGDWQQVPSPEPSPSGGADRQRLMVMVSSLGDMHATQMCIFFNMCNCNVVCENNVMVKKSP